MIGIAVISANVHAVHDEIRCTARTAAQGDPHRLDAQTVPGAGRHRAADGLRPRVFEEALALAPHHRFLGCVTFLLGVATCAAGLAEKQAFTAAPDPTDKFCADAMRLPNLLAEPAAFVAANAP